MHKNSEKLSFFIPFNDGYHYFCTRDKRYTMDTHKIEIHPLPPFLPTDARLLMLGTFPPDRKRWSMEFYYPNPQNDMWRIFGSVFTGDKDHFLRPDKKGFDRERIVAFLTERGIALCDTARAVIRTKGNASDQFLQIVEPVNLDALLEAIPACHTIVTTGQKATDTLLSLTRGTLPIIGGYTEFTYGGRTLRHYRMPSSSRAYPKPLSEKAAIYEKMFRETGLL